MFKWGKPKFITVAIVLQQSFWNASTELPFPDKVYTVNALLIRLMFNDQLFLPLPRNYCKVTIPRRESSFLFWRRLWHSSLWV